MDALTILQLNQLNQDFYQTISTDFDQTRQQPWAGWQPLLDFLDESNPTQIIDLGCGNGRFGVFLSQSRVISYLGLDSNSALLAKASEELKKKDVSFKLIEMDLVVSLTSNTFGTELDSILTNTIANSSTTNQLFTLFGVLHHIPSLQLRQQLFQDISTQLRPNDLIAVSCWQFDASPNLWQRKMTADQISQQTQLNPNQLETNDFILDWQRGKSALRYCHLTTDEELRQLAENSNLTIIKNWTADGKTNNLNNYYLLKKRG